MPFMGQDTRPKKSSIAEPPPLLGAHMSIAGGPVKALERSRSVGCTAVQMFVKNNMQWFAKDFTPADPQLFRIRPKRYLDTRVI